MSSIDKGLNVEFDSLVNKILIFNTSNNFTNKLWFSVTDLETNLNVCAWWCIFSPNSLQEWGLPDYYFKLKKSFKINVFDGETFNLIFCKNFTMKNIIDKKLWFKTKNLKDSNYANWYSVYDENEYNLKFSESDVVYDLGANVGTFTKFCSLNNVKHIYAFEPDIENYICMANTFKNENNITLINKAILDENKKEKFFIHEHSVSNSILNVSDIFLEIDCINLEDYILKNKFILPTIVKIDIEGCEFKFFEKLSNDFIKNTRIFIFEFHIFNLNDREMLFNNIFKKVLGLEFSIRSTKFTDLNSNIGTVIFEKI